MTEGNIASWKVKEGDSFSAGDILLEIETDKASMDVEASDDGVMAKIIASEGSKGVKVGTRIAVLADPGDDISSLELPEDDSSPQPVSPAASVQGGGPSGGEKEVKETPPTKQSTPETPKTSPVGPGQNPKYPLYPSVIALIHENHLSDADVAKIPATGPNNRLLKGDVLAYLGTIGSDYSQKQSERIEHLAHLDLSNVKVVPPVPRPEASTAEVPTTEVPTAEVPTTEPAPLPKQPPQEMSVSLAISLAEVLKVQKRIEETLGVTVPLSTFLARAVDIANDDLPRPKDEKPSSDDLFNAILGLNSVPTTSRGAYLPQIDALPRLVPARMVTPKPPKAKQPDIIDILSGKARPQRAGSPHSSLTGGSLATAGGAVNVFSLTVPRSEEQRARKFLERIKTILQVEPGRLIL